ncbi:FxSxx-COOH system tetratricopeptide repeat protein [Nonomuraea insulae]|uniref:FxSxx-COOH system tetratricopeptide repeat protein n=1 Tax=Nonomuraea insulae TaxID=1616787 RepID=A0ABW1D741_9ACTN
MSGTPVAPDEPAGGQPRIWIEGTASEQGRVYQAAGDQTINQNVLPEAVLRPVTEVAAPPGLVNLPRHTRTFVGRSDELAGLEAVLRGGGEVVVAAVHGLGGVGKSTLAAHYALAQARSPAPGQEHAAGGGLNPVWWITADSGPAVEAGLAGLATALQPELATVLPLEARAERATAWLAAHDGWLLVLDNVVDPADVRLLLERTLAGQVLVTSRLGEGWHHLDAHVLRLDVLGEREAIKLLARLAAPGLSRDVVQAGLDQGEVEGLDGAAELVRELGHLPLAIEQAGAYLHQTRLTPRAYLNLLRQQPAVMYDRAARGADAERTIARIWRLTLDQLADIPLAGALLRVLAWYGAEPIPRTLLDGLDTDASEVQHALGELAAYNMITLDSETVTVHRLVQAVARTPDPDDPHREAAAIDAARDQATRLLNDTLPATPWDPAGWPAWRTLLPHSTALIDHVPPNADTAATAYLFNQTGIYLDNQGAVTRAIACLERARTAWERVLGAAHPTTLASRNNLAGAYRAAGDLGRAIPLYEQTLVDFERVLGAAHPTTLASRNNLAGAYRAAGDLGRAIPLHEQTLADRERVLGSAHPATLISRNNLAYAYRAAGDLGRAIPLFETTLAERERVLGAAHPDTLASRGNLAYAYQVAGDLGRAIPLFETTLAEQERVLGAAHPHTLTSRNDLAMAYESAGDLGRAIALLEATLAERERVLGAAHPDTLTSRGNLAYAYESAGDLHRAIPLYEVTLADCERVLGAAHPTTLTSRHNLVYAYRAAGDLGQAIPMLEAMLAEREKVLGAAHPTTLAYRGNLAAAYWGAGDLGRAIPLFEVTLADCERGQGADHPDTLASRSNLATAYRAVGDLGRAIRLYEQTLADCERVLGLGHPTTQAVRTGLLQTTQHRDGS